MAKFWVISLKTVIDCLNYIYRSDIKQDKNHN